MSSLSVQMLTLKVLDTLGAAMGVMFLGPPVSLN